MRKWMMLLGFIFIAGPVAAQDRLTRLLVSGIEDSRTYAEDFIRPGAEAVLYNLSNGWYQSAEVKGFLGFELSVMGNASMNLDEHSTFTLNTEDYQNLAFTDAAVSREVATIFGQNDPEIQVQSFYETPSGDQEISEFELPSGMGSAMNFFPIAFLQARLGLFKGTEIKARYFPQINYGSLEAQLYGGALQHEFTSWIPASDLFPVAVSGFVGFTRMEGNYDFTAQEYLEGEDQHLTAQMDSWLFAGIVSTKFPIFNVYGGVGYIIGSSETRMLGSYVIIDENTGADVLTIDDPFNISHEVNDVTANLGISIELGILKLTADYQFQKYNVLSAGVHLGI